MNEIEILKEALRWYMGMYGCTPQRNNYDDYIEYSCNGYVTDKEEAEAITKSKKDSRFLGANCEICSIIRLSNHGGLEVW